MIGLHVTHPRRCLAQNVELLCQFQLSGILFEVIQYTSAVKKLYDLTSNVDIKQSYKRLVICFCTYSEESHSMTVGKCMLPQDVWMPTHTC